MLWFIIGLVVGFILACCAMVGKIVGKLKHVTDEDGTYLFLELNQPDVNKVLSHKYVVLEVETQK
jgi:hypothetical protein